VAFVIVFFAMLLFLITLLILDSFSLCSVFSRVSSVSCVCFLSVNQEASSCEIMLLLAVVDGADNEFDDFEDIIHKRTCCMASSYSADIFSISSVTALT
jgi:hypothetical protein